VPLGLAVMANLGSEGCFYGFPALFQMTAATAVHLGASTSLQSEIRREDLQGQVADCAQARRGRENCGNCVDRYGGRGDVAVGAAGNRHR
jgi:hypothetical protein